MAVIQISKILVRRGQEGLTGIPQLDPGEFGWAEDTENLYIGKRIAEGAVSDENTRVLTEKDLSNIFTLIGQAYSTATLNTVYRYREGVPGLDAVTTSTLQYKLDTIDPSLIDFGLTLSTNTYVAIGSELQTAIDTLFNNSDPAIRQDLRRTLLIPAGRYTLDSSVELPPHTKIKGAGPGITVIQYTNTLTTDAMFVTVDGNGNGYDSSMNTDPAKIARNVTIEGLTLEFPANLSTDAVLLSLDNVTGARVEDCQFRTVFDESTTGTYGITDYGVAIQLRGQGDIGTEQCQNISITNCEFNGLRTGVHGTGTVLTPSISYSKFDNLKQGVLFETYDSLPGPRNGYIAYNKFQDILEEAILVGENPDGRSSNILSTQNSFIRCGGTALNEFTTSSTVTSVISYLSAGNKTVDDYFARREYADNLEDLTDFWYNPYVRGRATIADNSVKTIPLTTGTNEYARIPISGENQVATVNYKLYGENQFRKGTILANITPTGLVALTDTYNYIETLKEDEEGKFIQASTGSGFNVLVLSTATNPRFADVKSSLGIWYITGEDYPGKSAYISNVLEYDGTYIVQTDSSDPEFNFWSTGTWTLLSAKTVDVSASYESIYVVNNNFVSLTMSNPSTDTTLTLDYQIDIQV